MHWVTRTGGLSLQLTGGVIRITLQFEMCRKCELKSFTQTIRYLHVYVEILNQYCVQGGLQIVTWIIYCLGLK